MEMKKIISVFLCICLMSGCGKSLNHGRPANDVVEYKGSEAESPLPSGTSNASAPTPEPSKSVLPSDSADTGSSVGKYVFYAVALIAACYGGCRLLYKFADIKPVPLDKIRSVKVMPEGCKKCYLWGSFFDWDTNEFVDEIPVKVENNGGGFYYCYGLNSSKLKPLKTWLRKIFGIKTPVYKPPVLSI